METTQNNKPSRDELRQKLRAKTNQSKLGRTNKKIRDAKLEGMREKAAKQQQEFMEALKKLSPEELKKFGVDPNLLNSLNSENTNNVIGEKEITVDSN